MSETKHQRLKQDLEELKLNYIAEHYRELLDDAARKNSSALDVLIQLIGGQAAARRDRALARRVREARLPKLKTLQEYDFEFPKRITGRRSSFKEKAIELKTAPKIRSARSGPRSKSSPAK